MDYKRGGQECGKLSGKAGVKLGGKRREKQVSIWGKVGKNKLSTGRRSYPQSYTQAYPRQGQELYPEIHRHY